MRLSLAAALAVWSAPAAACIVDQATLTAHPESVTVAEAGAPARAWFDDPVTRYDHFVLGRQTEPSSLWVDLPGNHGLCGTQAALDESHVFEDVAPRLGDLDGDGTNEVIVVRSHVDRGAQIAVYGHDGTDLRLLATTPYIGQAHRWLAPVGATDLDGDGAVEIAYVDRPHLARVLRVWRWTDGALTEVAAVSGVTNHRIGEPAITGGVRDCGAGPEMIVASADWSRLLALTFDGAAVAARDLGPFSAAAVTTAMTC
ncbi:FG-GAP repeat domain-containing protein [Wenxinia marina]|uniref:Family description n=1 Tax=Wenxinia marina DSM 24838 TaxID=1123501 RepID=A0A0D0NL70_9RHOB|nr:VCBS repeat-containing protein [Wenxinia marina]KIQ69055.1 Family description [Wenxinia marina DSM 24838]GGL69998.1 hypothetical protein GCM10011392_25640 [Wenxinia marina]